MYNYFTTSNNKNVYCIYPDKCPICDKFICPNNIFSKFEATSNITTIVFECPNCKKTFLSHFSSAKIQESKNCKTYINFELLTSFPKQIQNIIFSKHIMKLSPAFVQIYNQAYASEVYELNHLSGMGYRKALEFLIKDYCIYKNPDKALEIKNQLLKPVIDNFITDIKIHNLAIASTWLGNDETHYIRKHETKDINDLKAFIDTVVAYINYELISEEAEQLVNS